MLIFLGIIVIRDCITSQILDIVIVIWWYECFPGFKGCIRVEVSFYELTRLSYLF